jgi:hypothetical protein
MEKRPNVSRYLTLAVTFVALYAIVVTLPCRARTTQISYIAADEVQWLFLTFSNGAVGNARERTASSGNLGAKKPDKITLFDSGRDCPEPPS